MNLGILAFGYLDIDLVVRLLIGSADFNEADLSQQSEARKERTMLFALSVLRLIDKAKLGTVVEEADESVYWLEIVDRLRLVPGPDAPAALQEAIELRAIFSRSSGTARANSRELSMRRSIAKSMSK